MEVQRMLIQLHREANAKPKIVRLPPPRKSEQVSHADVSLIQSIKSQDDEDEEDAFGGYGFYTNSFGAIDKLIQGRRNRGRSVGTKIATSDY